MLHKLCVKTLIVAAGSAVLLSPLAMSKDLRPADVPDAVRNYVSQHYPDARDIDWDYDKNTGLYEVDFERGRLDFELELTPDGKLVRSKEDVEARNIPRAVADAALKRYPGARILEADRLMRDGQVIWEIDVKLDNGNRREARFTEDGKDFRY